jgi:type IV pilus assembly protein PilC
MSFFRYTVKNQHGETLKGKVEAQSRDQAANILRNRNLLVISVKEKESEQLEAFQAVFSAIKQDEVVNFTRQLSTMITAGLNLTEALDILKQQSKPAMAKVIDDILQDVEGGSTFAKSLEKQEKIFSRVYVQLVKAGETAGVLDEVMSRLADTLEKQKDFREKTKGALIYPVIVIIAMLIVGAVMMIFVVPKLTAMYKDLGAKLPLATQILIGMSNLMTHGILFLIAGIAAAYAAFRAWHKTKAGHLAFDRFMLKIPIMGILRQKVILTEFCRTTGLLLGAGISLLEALDIMADAMDNMLYQDAVRESAKQVEKGIPLSQAIGRYAVFPPILFQMIAVGEETGKMNEVLLKLSSYFESESEHAVKNLTTAFEPMIMIVLGIGVGALVLAIILPIYNITTSF